MSHAEDRSVVEVEGYASCTNEWCGAYVLREIADRTRGRCVECHRKYTAETLTGVEVVVRGTRVHMRRHAQSPSKGKSSKGSRAHNRAAAKARERARTRLSMIFPDLYDVLVAEERARVGLDPWPVDTVLREGDELDADETMAWAGVYHALEHGGTDAAENQE